MNDHDYTADNHQHYKPPTHVAKALIAHAVRNIPGKEQILAKCYPQTGTYNQGLKQHQYNDDGKWQFAYGN